MQGTGEALGVAAIDALHKLVLTFSRFPCLYERCIRERLTCVKHLRPVVGVRPSACCICTTVLLLAAD
jgi:hypothetical protein